MMVSQGTLMIPNTKASKIEKLYLEPAMSKYKYPPKRLLTIVVMVRSRYISLRLVFHNSLMFFPAMPKAV